MDTLYPSTMLFRARVDVDMQGRLAVTVVDALVPDIASGEESRLSRTELRPLLDRIASERGSALRVEIHEPDGKVFTDFHTTEPAPDTGAPTPDVTYDRKSTRRNYSHSSATRMTSLVCN